LPLRFVITSKLAQHEPRNWRGTSLLVSRAQLKDVDVTAAGGLVTVSDERSERDS
jgi:hypothetical protein